MTAPVDAQFEVVSRVNPKGRVFQEREWKIMLLGDRPVFDGLNCCSLSQYLADRVLGLPGMMIGVNQEQKHNKSWERESERLFTQSQQLNRPQERNVRGDKVNGGCQAQVPALRDGDPGEVRAAWWR